MIIPPSTLKAWPVIFREPGPARNTAKADTSSASLALPIGISSIIASLNSFISAVNEIYSKSKYSNRLNIKSYLQVVRLILNLFSALLIIAILSGRSPVYLLSGIGALTAVLMLIFKNTILSFVSSIQFQMPAQRRRHNVTKNLIKKESKFEEDAKKIIRNNVYF